MKRLVLVGLVIAMGCQGVERSPEPGGEPQTSVATAELGGGAEECGGVANFCGATLPTITLWKSLPQSTPSTVFMFYFASPNTFFVFGADPAAGLIRWGRYFAPAASGSVFTALASVNQPMGGIRQPPTCETCPPGSDWIAAFILESAKRVPISQQQAGDATGACYGP